MTSASLKCSPSASLRKKERSLRSLKMLRTKKKKFLALSFVHASNTRSLIVTLIEAIETILDRADFQDEGPIGNGWPSPELEAAQDWLEAWVAVQKTINPAWPRETYENTP